MSYARCLRMAISYGSTAFYFLLATATFCLLHDVDALREFGKLLLKGGSDQHTTHTDRVPGVGKFVQEGRGGDGGMMGWGWAVGWGWNGTGLRRYGMGHDEVGWGGGWNGGMGRGWDGMEVGGMG